MSGLPALNLTAGRGGAQSAFQYSVSYENPTYADYKPMETELIPLPRAVIYLLLAALVVLGAAYAIVGHLIKDLAHDIADCILGPQLEDKTNPTHDLQCSRKPFLPFSVDKSSVYGSHGQPEVCIPISKTSDTLHLPMSCNRDTDHRRERFQSI